MTIDITKLTDEKVGICVSGGLDSRTVATRLREDNVYVLGFSADLAQPDEDDISHVQERMGDCGVDTVIVDLKDDMAAACLDVVQTQATYDGGYWNTTDRKSTRLNSSHYS